MPTGDSFLTLTENLTFAAEPAGTQVFPTDTAGPTVASPTLLSSFTGADESPLSEGGIWSKLNSSNANSLQRVGNTLTGPSSGTTGAYYNVASYGPDVFVMVTMASAAAVNFVGPVARVAGEGGAATWDGYFLNIASNGVQIQRFDNSLFGANIGLLPQSLRRPVTSSDSYAQAVRYLHGGCHPARRPGRCWQAGRIRRTAAPGRVGIFGHPQGPAYSSTISLPVRG